MFSVLIRTAVLFAFVLYTVVVAGAEASPMKPNTALHAVAQELIDAGYREKQAVTERLTTIDDPKTLLFMQIMVEGDLYYRKDDRVVVIKGDDAVTTFFSGEEVTLESKRDIKKISVNTQ